MPSSASRRRTRRPGCPPPGSRRSARRSRAPRLLWIREVTEEPDQAGDEAGVALGGPALTSVPPLMTRTIWITIATRTTSARTPCHIRLARISDDLTPEGRDRPNPATASGVARSWTSPRLGEHVENTLGHQRRMTLWVPPVGPWTRRGRARRAARRRASRATAPSRSSPARRHRQERRRRGVARRAAAERRGGVAGRAVVDEGAPAFWPWRGSSNRAASRGSTRLSTWPARPARAGATRPPPGSVPTRKGRRAAGRRRAGRPAGRARRPPVGRKPRRCVCSTASPASSRHPAAGARHDPGARPGPAPPEALDELAAQPSVRTVPVDASARRTSRSSRRRHPPLLARPRATAPPRHPLFLREPPGCSTA